MSHSVSKNPINNTDQTDALVQFTLEKLDDLKAKEVLALDVRNQTSMTHYMIIATGTSTQHVKSLAQNLIQESKQKSLDIIGHEGVLTGEWALVDLGDVVVHIMLAGVREYYQLEKLWSMDITEPALKTLRKQ